VGLGEGNKDAKARVLIYFQAPTPACSVYRTPGIQDCYVIFGARNGEHRGSMTVEAKISQIGQYCFERNPQWPGASHVQILTTYSKANMVCPKYMRTSSFGAEGDVIARRHENAS
jgi:hypothetical protein